MDLKSKIFLKQPRENDGSKTSNRYDFQKDWAICKLIELHSKLDDYLLCFEFHDDIIIFDSTTDPKSLKCYQVKTKDSPHWLISALTAQKPSKSGAQPSILAKLYLHLSEYGTNVDSLCFVTNSKLKATLANNSDCLSLGTFQLKELCDADLKKLSDKLEVELNTKDLKKFYEMTTVLLGELDIGHHSDITKAKLAKLIETLMPRVKYQIGPLYKTIFDEVKSKTNVEEQVVNFERLKELKSISREDFSGYLSVLSEDDSMRELTLAIEGRLNAELIDYKFVSGFKEQAKIYEIGRMNHADKNLSLAVKLVQEAILKHPSTAANLYQKMDEIYTIIPVGTNVLSDLYMKTIILFELYGKG